MKRRRIPSRTQPPTPEQIAWIRQWQWKEGQRRRRDDESGTKVIPTPVRHGVISKDEEGIDIKFCICFYGVVGRSLKHTIKSIQKNIFAPLDEAGITYDVYIHNNEVEALNTKRAKEDNCPIDKDCWKLLDPVGYASEVQDKAPTNAERFDNEFSHIPDQFNDNKQSYKFALYEMYSCKKVTELWKERPTYECYLYLRPDLEYVHRINLDFIKEQMRRGDWRNVIMTPSWHNHAGEGLNDRIAFGGRDAMVAWGRRFDYIDEFLTTVDRSYKTVKHNKHFVAELYTHWVIVEKFGLENVHILGEKTKRFPKGSPFWARRVRGGGRVHRLDLREFPGD